MTGMNRLSVTRRILTTTALAGLATGLLGLTTGPAAAQETPSGQLEIVLDSSGSMAAPDPGGGIKIDAARSALADVVDALPEEVTLGVRAYGGRFEDQTRGCTDTRLVVPMGPLDRAGSKAAFAGFQPLGYTPIALSLEQAAADFTSEGPRTIVLVSDGEETCGGNPCEVARTLAGSGVDLRVDTVGYAPDAATRQQLQCIADATGGEYSEAPDGDALTEQLTRLSDRAFRAYEVSGEPVTGSDLSADAPLLEPGQYTDTLPGGTTRWYAVDLPAGATPYFAATTVPPSGAKVEQLASVVELEIVNSLGQRCGSTSESVSQYFGGVPTTNVARPGVVDGEWEGSFRFADCGPPGRYAVGVSSGFFEGDVELPLELRYLLEPSVRNAELLPAPVTDPMGAQPTSGAERGEVDGGAAFASAAELQPGVYRTDIKPGETLYFAVPVGWGQSLSYAATLPGDATPESAGAVSLVLYTQAYSPARVPVPEGDLSTYAGYTGQYGGEVTASEALPPVLWRNRESDDARIAATSLAGDQIIRVNLGKLSDYEDALPLRLAVSVTGETSGAPDYADVPGEESSEPTPTGEPGSGSDPGSSPETGSVDAGTDGASAADVELQETASATYKTAAYTGGGVIAVLVAATLVLLPWLRGRRR